MNLPDYEDFADVEKLNENFEIIDAQMKSTEDALTTHLDEIVSHHLVVNRDVSLAGTQRIESPFKLKTATISAVLTNTDKYCIGSIAETGGQFNMHKNHDGKVYYENNLITLSTATGMIRGYIDNITDTGFDINWFKEGGPTGNLQMSMCITTHGR